MKIANFQAESVVNGPGKRAVLWFQGCTLACPGCFNPHTHTKNAGENKTVQDIIDWLRPLPVDGITLSGGEPFQQYPELLELLKTIRQELPHLSIVIFSGFYLHELNKFGSEALELTDAVIAGRYEQTQHVGDKLIGSANQEIVVFPHSIYTVEQFSDMKHSEVRIDTEGLIRITGIAPVLLNA